MGIIKPQAEKNAMRKHMRQLLRDMHARQLADKSHAVCKNLVAQDEFHRAGTVMLFLAMVHEVDPADIARAGWAAGKRIVAPRVDRNNWRLDPLEIHSFDSGLKISVSGILEPAEGEPLDAGEIDLVIVPGLAFDRYGNRLGRGGGYYDRFLAQPNLHAVTCAIALAEQVVDRAPTDDHDRPVDMLVTDADVLRFNT